MKDRVEFGLGNRNPDVLTCIANLSSDEVFTPPEFANKMLDRLADAWANDHEGADIWADSTLRFLDPFTKSGVFLREITKRLVSGLEDEIPDLVDRVDHILTQQVFGIGITQLTSLIARRSLYCSKWANGQHSVARSFETDDGNVWFEPMDHSWAGGTEWVLTADAQGNQVKQAINGKCRYCGASQTTLDRGEGLETHAYAFIHTNDIKASLAQLFGADMQFDVIIGNPPYQLGDGGGEGASAIPLYNKFVEQAKKLEPRQLLMVIPARWYSGGKGLDDFRDSMLTDGHVAEIHDFAETDLVFPGVNIRGGVCYFRWSQTHQGPALVVNYSKTREPDQTVRPLLEPGLSTFVRYNEAVPILRKVLAQGEATYDSRVQSRNPFGIPSNFTDFSRSKTSKTPILLFRSRRGSSDDKQVYVAESHIKSNREFADKVKVLVSKASPGGDEYPHAVFSLPIVAPKGSVSTETYLIVDFPRSMVQARNLVSYMETRFFRFLVSLIKNTQNISKSSFGFVPIQDLTQPWTDDLLYQKYGITPKEVRFIERMIRPMGEVGDEDNG